MGAEPESRKATMADGFKYHQYQVVGRHLPTESDPSPSLYRMKVWAVDEVCARSKFWYFIKRIKRVKKANGQIIAVNEIFEKDPATESEPPASRLSRPESWPTRIARDQTSLSSTRRTLPSHSQSRPRGLLRRSTGRPSRPTGQTLLTSKVARDSVYIKDARGIVNRFPQVFFSFFPVSPSPSPPLPHKEKNVVHTHK